MTLAESSRPPWAEGPTDLGRDMERMATDQKAAQESLLQYCKPVELYNIIQRRATIQPVFLQRCLSYKIESARQKRTKMTISALQHPGGKEETEPVQLFVTVTSCLSSEKDYEDYRLSHTRLLKMPSVTCQSTCQEEIIFLLPDIRKLHLQSNKDSNVILIIMIGGNGREGADNSLNSCDGHVFWGRLSIAAVCRNWMNCAETWPGFNGSKVDIECDVDLHHGDLKNGDFSEGQAIRLRRLPSEDKPYQIRLRISGEEIGRSLILSNVKPQNGSIEAVQTPKRYGVVIFHYLYHFNKLRQIEVTENFSCPFCLVCCCSYKGVKCHLGSSHDFFSFEYLESDGFQIVLVKCRNEVTDSGGDMSDPRLKKFFYWSGTGHFRKKRLPKVVRELKGNIPNDVDRTMPVAVRKTRENSTGSYKDSTCTNIKKQCNDPESAVCRPTQQHDIGSKKDQQPKTPVAPLPPQKKPKVVLETLYQQVSTTLKSSESKICAPSDPAKLFSVKSVQPLAHRAERKRKVVTERAAARNRALLQKRQFFHSHTAQPMALEQLLSDKDSEDELDDAIADFEDRRMLEDFVDVSTDEQDLMHRWNTFVRKQRIIADGHCSWALEAFARLHREEFHKLPTMRRCFMLMLVKFWNHHLIDGRVMDGCLSIVDNFH